MEELRLAAEAYYKNSSSDFQISATKFFESMDTNRDDRVSFHEFTEFLQQNGYNWVNPGMFSQLDTNKDGGLDFWEFLTFYYIVKTRFVHCKGCSAQLHGLHFTCVTCFDSGGDTFDLCARCYGRKQFRHDHKLFLDNYVLLRTKKGISPKMNVNQALTQPRTSHGSSLNRLFQVLEVAITLGSFLGGCSIM